MPTSRSAQALAAAFMALCFLGALTMGTQAAEAVAHKIFSVDGPKSARKLGLRLQTRAQHADLQALALVLAGRMKAGETLATIDFFLPGMELSAPPWARATLQPVAKIDVFGMRAEEEAALRAQAALDTRDVMGVWITAPPALPGTLTIYRNGSRAYAAEWHLRSGQKTSDELTMTRVSRGQRFDVVDGDGAYYLATWGGELLLGDRSRVIAVAERLVLEPKKPEAEAARSAAPVSPAAAARNATQTAPAAAPASSQAAVAPAAEAPPVAKARPGRTAKRAPTQKPSSSVADLMGGSISR